MRSELLQEYFDRVHWFSLVVFEPLLRRQLKSIEDGLAYDSQRDFLLLLAIMLGVAAWYAAKRCRISDTLPRLTWTNWQDKLIRHVETHLFELMERTSLASVQTSILLGSYLSYHGKPNSSFALLGATIKSAQALGLHREPVGSFNEREQRKRVWWTIYTWDRYNARYYVIRS